MGQEVRYRVRGGHALHGTAFIQGAKNAVLPMIGAALLASKGRTVLRNVPVIEDVRRALELAEYVGAKVEFHEAERTIVIDATGLNDPNRAVLPASIASRFRGSVLFIPALMHRMGRARIEGWADATSAAATLTSTTGVLRGWAPRSPRTRSASTST